MDSTRKVNYRFIIRLGTLVFVVILAVGLVLLGYVAAARHATGHYAPIGPPQNEKHKPVDDAN